MTEQRKFPGRTLEFAGELKDGSVVHATRVEQSDSYHYDEKTACGRYADPAWCWYPTPKESKVTCLSCLAVID